MKEEPFIMKTQMMVKYLEIVVLIVSPCFSAPRALTRSSTISNKYFACVHDQFNEKQILAAVVAPNFLTTTRGSEAERGQ